MRKKKTPASKTIKDAFIQELVSIGETAISQYEALKKELREEAKEGLISEDKFKLLMRDLNLSAKKTEKAKAMKPKKPLRLDDETELNLNTTNEPPFSFDEERNILSLNDHVELIYDNLPDITCQIIEKNYCLLNTEAKNVKITATTNDILGLDISSITYTTGNGNTIILDLSQIFETLQKIDF